MTKRVGKNLDIQALRAFAMIFVFFEHMAVVLKQSVFTFHGVTPHLWTGVEIFMVISGFVIVRSIIDRSEPGSFWSKSDFQQFWRRRYFRLFPASVVWLTLGLVATPFLGFDVHDAWLNGRGAFFALVGSYNIFAAYCITYPMNPDQFCPVNGITRIYWSLSLEEQFYFFVTCGLFFISKRRVLMLGLGTVMAVYLVWLFRDSVTVTFLYRITCRSYGLFFGALIAVYGAQLTEMAKRIRKNERTIIVITLLLLIPYLPNIPYDIGLLLVNCASIAILLCLLPDHSISRGRAGAILVWIGERSYSMYLCHFTLIYVVFETFKKISGANTVGLEENYGLTFLSFFTIMTAADLTYRFVEKPMIIKGHFLSTTEK